MDPSKGYPGLRYILLHRFAHALIRQLAVECGYTTASIGERIYAQDPVDGDPMAGVLIYTAAADREGTLGGLCALGEQRRWAASGPRSGANGLCSSDPSCAEHAAVAGRFVARRRLPCLHVPARDLMRTGEQVSRPGTLGRDRQTI